MGHTKVESCAACCSASEHYGSIDHERMFCLRSYLRGDSATTQLEEQKKRLFHEVQVIRRQMGFLSLQSMASVPKVPKTENVDDESANNYCCYEAKSDEGDLSREIELCCEPLPKGWEQCLDLKTGEFYYIDRSCGKKTKRDPRSILKQVEKDINALISSVCGNAKIKDSESSLSPNSSNIISDIPTLKSLFECNFFVEDDGKLAILKGCNKCLSYILIPKGIKNCPLCKTLLFEV